MTTFVCYAIGTNTISHCLEYQTTTEVVSGYECKKCAEGYMLNSSLTACIKVTEVKNCAYYTTEKC